MPFLTAIVWTYGGGVIFLIGILYDKRYVWLWTVAMALWLGSLSYIWNFFPRNALPVPAIRIATFNMDAAHYSRPQIERIADSLRRWHPHILCLQEVYLGDYTVEGFVQRVGYPYYDFLDAKRQMGMLILSDFPIEKGIVHKLLSGTTNGFHEAWIRLPTGERARVLNVHFPSYRLGRETAWRWEWLSHIWQKQSEFYQSLRQRIECRTDPTWICGDFNTLPFHPLYRVLSACFHDSYEAAMIGMGPTWRHLLRIDYIWGSAAASLYRTRWLPGQSHAYVEAMYALSPKDATFAAKGR